MATKYCDVSLATGLNDGTSTANAWQSLVDVLDGTPTSGSYAAGDIIIIRTADSGGDLSESTSVALTTPEKTSSVGNPVEWRFDDGTTWAQSGTFTLTFTTSGDWVIQSGNIINGGRVPGTYGLEVEFDGTSDQDFVPQSSVAIYGVHFTRGTNPTAGVESRMDIITFAAGDPLSFYNCKFDFTTPKAGGTNPTLGGQFQIGSANVKIVIENSEIRLNPAISVDGFIAEIAVSGSMKFFNVSFTNTASTHWVWLTSLNIAGNRSSIIYLKAVDLGLMSIDNYTWPTAVETVGNLQFVAENLKGAGGFMVITSTCWYEYNSTGNFPYLNATIPDSGTGWSTRVFPHQSNVRPTRLAQLGEYSKWYNAAAATKDIRLELLIRDTSADTNAYDNPQKDEWWIEVSYVDNSTGLLTYETSYTTGALATSTASWSAVTYGGDSYDKYKIVVTTANSIKQYTFVTIRIYSSLNSGGTSDFYFIDPDFQIE